MCQKLDHTSPDKHSPLMMWVLFSPSHPPGKRGCNSTQQTAPTESNIETLDVTSVSKPLTYLIINMHTSNFGVSVPVSMLCFSSVLQASISASCLSVLDPRGVFGLSPPGTSLFSECWEAEDGLGADLSFFTYPT